jgi:benzodiazapine receptor
VHADRFHALLPLDAAHATNLAAIRTWCGIWIGKVGFMQKTQGGAAPSIGVVIAVHLFFVVAVVGMGAWLGTNNIPGPWYEALIKPWFTPPNWMFGPVWAVLYVCIGVVGARKALYGGAQGVWLMQMAANFAWSPVFFGMQQPMAALPIVVVMLLSILAFILLEWRRDRISALLFLPYAAWVSVATALNTAIVVLN